MPIYKSDETTKDGRSYYFKVNYKDVFGNTKTYKSKKYKTRKEASMSEAEFKINTGSLCNNTTVTIQEAYIDYMNIYKQELKPQTIKKTDDLFTHIEPLYKIKISELNLSNIQAWRNYLEKKNLSASYKNKIQGLLKRIIKHSSEYYNTPDTAIKFIKPYKSHELKKEMDFFTFDEYKKFSSVIDDPEYKSFFDMLYFLGLRQGELQALTFNDIDFDKKLITINKTLTTKLKGETYFISTPKTKNSNRTLPLSNLLLMDLEQQMNYYKQFTDYSNNWFVFGGNVPFRETTIQVHKNNYCKLANVKQIRIHDFRHSCASLLINNGATIVLVSKWLGHSKISMTLNTYTHLYKSELESITALMNTLE